MPLITLTTDYGIANHDIAVLKGQLYKQCKDIIIADISHSVKPHDIIGTAYLLKEVYRNFPESSFHFVDVNARDGNDRILLIVKDKQYFILPDNGIITLVFPNENFDAFVVGSLDNAIISALCIEVVNKIKANDNPKLHFIPTTDYVKMNALVSVESDSVIRAAVFYIDNYGNAIVNVTKAQFDRFVLESRFSIQFRSYRINKISEYYNDVPDGENLCRFNDAGYLEIAINRGDAARLMGLNYGSMVLIEKL